MGYATPADVGISDDRNAHLARNSAEPGTDYKTPYGTDIRMAGNGVIAVSDHSPAGPEGRRLRIDLDDGRTVDYIHLSSIQGRVGQRVSRGQKGIARSGASGYGKDHYYGPHVHVTLRARKGLPYSDTLDFENYLGDEPVAQDAGGIVKPGNPGDYNPFGIKWSAGLQKIAKLYGYRGAIDGKFGAGSMAGFAQFLRVNWGYKGNDVLGPVMWAAIARWLRARWGYVGNDVPGPVMRAALSRAEAENYKAL